MDSIINNISNAVPVPENEYLGEDGLLHCSVCNRNTQTRIEVPWEPGKARVVRCICDCKKQELEAHKERERQEEIERNRYDCFNGTNMKPWNFDNDDKRNPGLSKSMESYVKDFTDYKREGKGLLLHGECGTGKTYYAAAIANALIDKGYLVKMTNFFQLANQLWDAKEGKQAFVDHLNKYTLLIIDDFGTEQDTTYMKSQVYNFIDARYRSGLPLIITTNLTPEEIKNPGDIAYQRVCDRLLERCVPVEVGGGSRRRQKFAKTFGAFKEKLGL